MADTPPTAIDEITDRTQIRVLLYQSGQQVTAPLEIISPPAPQGDFSGPAVAVVDNIVTFADTTGKLGKDSGVAVSSLAPKASPTFTGTPTAPTATAGTNTTQIATTAFVAALSTVYQAASTVLTALASIGTAVAGDIIYASAAGTWARLAKGTAGQSLRMNAGATAPQWITPLLQKAYDSGQQTITAAGSLTLAHGLGTTPKLYKAFAQCTTADLNYSIGDEVEIFNDAANNRGLVITPDATNLNIRFGSAATTLAGVNKTTGSMNTGLTNASWRLVVRAWA